MELSESEIKIIKAHREQLNNNNSIHEELPIYSLSNNQVRNIVLQLKNIAIKGRFGEDRFSTRRTINEIIDRWEIRIKENVPILSAQRKERKLCQKQC